ncbi:RRQRL motif-containing zinc-binding protein [Streptacidiphilus sp. N1-12]|uniref:RRQRL motif-containing zinc-binding protein n=1 Tax=Streptacidiphilus alkalitolerans TaxID=3342712 RepID=A0ABV6WS73_9ACTN
MRAKDWDPTGEHHGGMPTWPWRHAEPGLKTRRQLRDLGLRPGGCPPVGQILCRRGKRVAYLYALADAVPKLPMTNAKWAALDRAMAARQTCPRCRVRFPHCLPLRTLGSCWGCSDDSAEMAAAA